MALEGETLKNWKLGKKLGAGACSDVYAAEPVDANVDTSGHAFVIKVSPLVVVPASKNTGKKRKKSAAERNADALYAEHLMYQSHLRDFPGIPYLPTGAYGEDKGYRFLVIQRLGRTLEDVLQDEGPIPSATAAQLGLNLLGTLQHIHTKNIVYVDVKPENFMLDAEKENQVFFVDFGIADRYVTAAGKHKEFKVGNVVGTPTFLSLSCHGGATASRRDDVEALLNVLIYLQRGDLPWQTASNDSEGAKIKKDTPVEDLCKALPREWSAMLLKARQCEFEDKPDYEYYADCFKKLGASTRFNDRFHWGEKSKVAKAVSKPSTTSSPVRKKPQVRKSSNAKDTKNVDSENISKPVIPTAKKPVAPKKAATSAKVSSTTRKVRTESASTDLDEKKTTVTSRARDPDRRRKAAAQAVAAAAAAEAAAQRAEKTGRYNLRSSTK